jgi:uncharacterized protein (DUF433 family)
LAIETETTLDSYFEFHGDGAIWIRGHRVGIDLLIADYKTGKNPQQIAEEFDTIRLEDVYATSTYYLRHQRRLDAWMAAMDERFAQAEQESRNNLSPAAQRLREIWRQGWPPR